MKHPVNGREDSAAAKQAMRAVRFLETPLLALERIYSNWLAEVRVDTRDRRQLSAHMQADVRQNLADLCALRRALGMLEHHAQALLRYVSCQGPGASKPSHERRTTADVPRDEGGGGSRPVRRDWPLCVFGPGGDFAHDERGRGVGEIKAQSSNRQSSNGEIGGHIEGQIDPRERARAAAGRRAGLRDERGIVLPSPEEMMGGRA